jgi:hypothetical protein
MRARETCGLGGCVAAAASFALVLALAFASAATAAAPVVSVFPIAGSRLATQRTQISFRGVPAAKLGTLTVTGSRSGTHAGRIVPDSDGHGASFIPEKPFVAGEVVTVHTTLNIAGGSGGTYRFTIERPYGRILPPGGRFAAPRTNGDVKHFVSRPDLAPAAVRVIRGHASGGDIFLAPMRGPVQWGPMIVDPHGSLVWFDPVRHANTWAANVHSQQLLGQPVLTWWQGFVNAGIGQGHDVILDDHYRPIAAVRAGNGLSADLHEFKITAQDTALITAYSLVHWPGSSIGGRKDMSVLNCTVQEIDIPTGNVLFQWDSLDHVPLSDSYTKPPASNRHPYDYFHINSVQEDSDGSLVISARNTWAVYDVNHSTAALMWQIGGKHSSFKMGPGTATAFQHDARLHADGLMTIFDDGGSPRVHSQSRVVLERVNTTNHTVTLVHQFDHSPKLLVSVEGSAQLLPSGDVFVGWGQQPYVSEFDASGRQIFDGRIVGPNTNYRAFDEPWTAQPASPPAVAIRRDADGVSTAYATWNGATDVAAWELLGGPSPAALQRLAVVPRHGFETAIPVHDEQPYFQVRALGSTGQQLASSSTVGSARARASIFGHTAFISPGGVGAIDVGCFATTPCHLSGSVSDGHTKIGQLTPETVAANGGGLMFFQLTSQGRAWLADAAAHRLGVTASVHDSGGGTGSSNITLVPYRTSGPARKYAVTQAASLRLFGHTAFVSSGGVGGVLAMCPSSEPCHVKLTVAKGGTVLARAGSQFIGAEDGGILLFKLTSAGSAMLDGAAGNELSAQLTAVNGGDTAKAQISLLRYG